MARRDDDDAPWLAEAGGSRASTTVTRRSFFWTALILLSLAAVTAVGLILLFSKKDTGSTAGYMNPEQAPLITAEPGPYKITPADPKGMDVEGQGQTIYATGEGIDTGSVIDQSAMPEEPIARPGTEPREPPPGPPRNLLPTPAPAPPTATAPAAEVPAKPQPAPAPKPAAQAPAEKPPAAKPAATPPKKSAGIVQLGAFSSAEKAEAAWAKLAGKHGLSGKRVIAVESNGQTLYRLRATGNSAEICQKLKSAGDACAVVE